MKAKEIREKFLNYFKEKGHEIVPSAPIVVHNDPTLMFTNAGMNQFKDYFLGNQHPENKRVADTQKCLRVSGKHNDLEEVGFDTYHHTMFEMLGNWSFGDYFKEEAIQWAWELLTDVYGLPEDRMYATVFEGDNSEGLEEDTEARGHWLKHLPKERILNGSKKDNFWEMGDTGPCGPCSEIHIDLRPESEVKKTPGKDLVNQDHPQVVEVWNLVFIQFNRMSNGDLKELPEKHVDTGMGFERLVMAIQAKMSNYDTDVFSPLMSLTANMAGVQYGKDKDKDVAIRVISDHIRAISFAIADGQLPGNVKAGYVIRRILRRAVRYGYTFLNFHEPFLHKLIPVLTEQFNEVFPELTQQKDFVEKVVREEEVSFLRTLEHGLKLIDSLVDDSKEGSISGESVFKLYDTYGFPKDLTLLILREKNALSLLNKGWEKAFEGMLTEQKERSKSAAKQEAGDWEVVESVEGVEFLGYEYLESTSKIVKYRQVKEKSRSYFQLVLDRTPFYAESGGQVGDRGALIQGDKKVGVFDTKRENDLIIHFCKELPANLDEPLVARVSETKRRLTENNHSATHLVHAALRQVLGDHVQQRGSLVNENLLRFDFSHFAKMSDAEIREVELIVNQRIRQNIPLDEKRNVPIDEAKSLGAMALFGEKYGDFVRVITFDPSYSVELCGGTHVMSTGKIGYFKIVSEGSVAAGVRRIEAITANKSEEFINNELDKLVALNELLKSPQDVVKSVHSLLQEKQQLQKEYEALLAEKSKSIKEDIKAGIQIQDGINACFYQGSFPDNDTIKQIAFDLKREVDQLVLILAGNVSGRPNLTVMIDDKLVESAGLNASDIVRSISKHIQGGGGGQAFYATAGGKNVDGLSSALEEARKLISEKIGLSV